FSATGAIRAVGYRNAYHPIICEIMSERAGGAPWLYYHSINHKLVRPIGAAAGRLEGNISIRTNRSSCSGGKSTIWQWSYGVDDCVRYSGTAGCISNPNCNTLAI